MPATLPNLIIAGVSKGGSTALAGYLAQHPDICLARSQEVFYALAGGASDTMLRPYLRGFRHRRDERYLCEHGATYFFGGGEIIGSIQRWQPDARILMTVRDPADRLWSAYNYKKSKFRLARDASFDGFLSESERRLERGIDTVPDPVWRELSIGFYDRTVIPWLDAFDDRIRIVFFERWIKDPAAALRELCRWLGIGESPVEGFDYSTRNRTVLHRNPLVKDVAYAVNRRTAHALERTPRLKERFRRLYYTINGERVTEEMQPEARARLREIYRESNAGLGRALRERGYQELPAWIPDVPP